MKNSRNEGKIVPFPNLKQRLLDKGMEALQQKKYEDALDLLQQTLEIDNELHEVHLAVMVCSFELGYLEEAKKHGETMLQQDIGDYYEVLQIYLTVLIQLKQYDEVEETIESVLEDGKLPPETVENFYRLLDFSRKMTVSDVLEKPVIEVEKILEDIPFSEQWGIVQALRNERLGISFSFKTLDSFLQDELKHPMLKTGILQMFLEKEIIRDIKVEKFSNTIMVNTGELHDMETHPFSQKVLVKLDEILGNENPSLFEVVKELWLRHLYVMYPFIPQPEDVSVWAAGLHKVGYDLHGIDVELEEVAQMYQITGEEIRSCCIRIQEVEGISFIE